MYVLESQNSFTSSSSMSEKMVSRLGGVLIFFMCKLFLHSLLLEKTP
jgi:hypothetical protein